MKAEEPNVDQLFRQSVRYIIPSYQRNYTWEADDQWIPFWEDIVGVAEKTLNEGDPSSSPSHFMGAIITKFLGKNGYIYEYVVVDGQQRLTTIALAMEAFRSVLQQRGHKRSASQLKTLLVNPENDRQTDRDRLKLRPKGRDYGMYEAVLTASLDGSALPDAGRLGECYSFFERHCRSWLAKSSRASEDRLADALIETIRSRLQFADIRLAESENEHGIFEALNARGKRLTEWEKTKSYLLSLAAEYASPGDRDAGSKIYERHFRHFDEDAYWSQEVRVARFVGPQIDWYLYNSLQVDLGRRVPAERVYREFRKRSQETLRGAAEEYPAELTALVEGARKFRSLVGRMDSNGKRVEMDGASSQMIERILALRLTSLLPPLFAVYLKTGTDTDWRDAMRVCDSYIMRRLAVNARFASVDDASQRLLEKIAPVQTRRDAVAELISSLEAEPWGNRWPSDDELERRVVKHPIYGRAASYRIRWVLEAVAPHYTPPEAGVPFAADGGFEIEHVVPQECDDHWSAVLAADEDAEEFIHCLGNLTIVTQRMNGRLGNRGWKHKRELLLRDTVAMNQEIARAVPPEEDWNREHVERRGLKLAEIMMGLWPGAQALKGELGFT